MVSAWSPNSCVLNSRLTRLTDMWGTRNHLSGYPTYQDLTSKCAIEPPWALKSHEREIEC
jgi:hypothetical protein